MQLKYYSIDNAPADYMVRAAKLAEWLGVGRTTLWRWLKEGKLPAPVKLSERVTAWRVGDIRAWLAARAQG